MGLGEVLGAAFLLYGQIVAIMNPFTAVNNYITLTQELSIEEARAVLRKSMAVVLFLGLLFIFAGRLILEFYHLSLAALRFGGGILLMYIAVDMLGGSPRSRQVDPGEVAVVPLATPMIVGPGTMTLLIHLGSTEDPILVTVAFLASAATVAATLYAARLITRILGRNGVKAMARFMALIIASVAAEMLHGAVVYWVRELGLA